MGKKPKIVIDDSVAAVTFTHERGGEICHLFRVHTDNLCRRKSPFCTEGFVVFGDLPQMANGFGYCEKCLEYWVNNTAFKVTLTTKATRDFEVI
jgi:hypothetical protein